MTASRRRSDHSVADDKRIDRLQALVTERVERGGAVGVHRTASGYRVVVFDARGGEVLAAESESKSKALEDAIWELRYIGVPGREGLWDRAPRKARETKRVEEMGSAGPVEGGER